jgi:hypothetical protein
MKNEWLNEVLPRSLKKENEEEMKDSPIKKRNTNYTNKNKEKLDKLE